MQSLVRRPHHKQLRMLCSTNLKIGGFHLERHFTDRMDRPGPDINSMDPVAHNLIIGSNSLAGIRGGTKSVTKEEKVTIDFAFSILVTIKKKLKKVKF